MNKQKYLFVDRDGTLIEEPEDFQIDSFEKLKFIEHSFKSLNFLSNKLGYKLVMVTNQDGLGTESFPEDDFWPVQNFIIDTLKGEGIVFDDILIDRSTEDNPSSGRKPGTKMLEPLIKNCDISSSVVIGDRLSDVELAKNLGCKAVLLNESLKLPNNLNSSCILQTSSWLDIVATLNLGSRHVSYERSTKETQIEVELDLDSTQPSEISTGIGFFDHMLEQIFKHSHTCGKIMAKGDLQVDEHHTIEDVGICLGHALIDAVGDKAGMQRYGFALPMDEASATVLIDFSGRGDFVWEAEFKREMIGDFPTEMFKHFFKSIALEGKITLHIKAEGENEHHKIEGIFKAFARALKMAIARDPWSNYIASTKGVI